LTRGGGGVGGELKVLIDIALLTASALLRPSVTFHTKPSLAVTVGQSHAVISDILIS